MTKPSNHTTQSNLQALEQAQRADSALFQAVAGWESPVLDQVLPPLSNLANNSMLWVGTSAAIAALGGNKGRFVAAKGLVAIGITSAVANLAAKNLVRRKRPSTGVPEERWIEQPDSSSFPSGHTASAAAFSATIGGEYRMLYIPVNAAAAAVGFSRVYTGVHYPGDVLVGWLLGRVVAGVLDVVWPRRWS